MRRLAGMLSKMDEDALKQRKEYDQVISIEEYVRPAGLLGGVGRSTSLGSETPHRAPAPPFSLPRSGGVMGRHVDFAFEARGATIYLCTERHASKNTPSAAALVTHTRTGPCRAPTTLENPKPRYLAVSV